MVLVCCLPLLTLFAPAYLVELVGIPTIKLQVLLTLGEIKILDIVDGKAVCPLNINTDIKQPALAYLILEIKLPDSFVRQG